MEDIQWRIFGGDYSMEDIRWRIFDGGYAMEDVRWRIFNGDIRWRYSMEIFDGG